VTEGFLLVDKPAGPTSHDMVNVVRRALATRRVGHGGTLDPFATGLLPLLVGRATRLMPYLLGLPKSYTGKIRLGGRTNTDDLTGVVIEERDATRVTDAALTSAFVEHTGQLEQRPPEYSAKKIGGRPAHRRARSGEHVTLPTQSVEVFDLHIVHRDGPEVSFHAAVSSGTYIRALARDIGEALGCGAYLAALRRLTVGPWDVEDAVLLAEIEAGTVSLRPAAEAVPHLPTRPLDASERVAVQHGRPLADARAWDAPAVALIADETLVAIAEPAGEFLKPRVVFEP